MKVRELIELLSRFDIEAEVVITTQPNYPMEHAVAGVTLRAALGDEPVRAEAPGSTPSDVMLVEGAWLRYGDLAAWDTARRR